MAASNSRGRRCARGPPPQCKEIRERQGGGENKRERPKRQQCVAAFVGVVVDEERGEREEEWGGEQGEAAICVQRNWIPLFPR